MDFSLIDIDSYDKTTFGKCIREQREEVYHLIIGKL